MTAFYKDPRGQLYFATANPGKLFRLSSEHAARGTYESEPSDAQMLATWGALSWHGTGPERQQDRARDAQRQHRDTGRHLERVVSGFWTGRRLTHHQPQGAIPPVARGAHGQGRRSGPHVGHRGLSAAKPAADRPVDHRPSARHRVPEAVHDRRTRSRRLRRSDDARSQAHLRGPDTSGLVGAPALGRRTYQKGLQTLAWRADDENDDDLVYDVLYRREGETEWTPLRRGLDEPILVWDTTIVPNGTYFVRIVASDSPSNPAGTALAGERDSTAFQIDHTPPAIVVGGVRTDGARTTLAFDVTDADSPVARVEYSRDGGLRWTAVFPKDGIADSKSERYELTIDGEIGENGITIRASDSMNNTDTTHVGARAPARR